jgi:EAL domain-containing protein (putative c-di-GMP-specific phosphodiesterase class I)
MRALLTAALKRALDQNELELHYQPQFRRDSTLFGMEALLRWTDVDLGPVPPSTFIPIAEDTRLILKIGEWVLRTACIQVRKWRLAGFEDIKVGVNVSVVQFEEEDFVESVISILGETETPGSCVQLELTESIVLKDLERAAGKLQKLRNLGVTCVIDDFGTGYSGLKYLQELPLDGIKIDRTFVQRAVSHHDRHGAAIIRMIMVLAENLNLSVVAEGIETQSQMEFLQNAGCELMQGFLLGKPAPADELEPLLNASRPFGDATPGEPMVSMRKDTPVGAT